MKGWTAYAQGGEYYIRLSEQLALEQLSSNKCELSSLVCPYLKGLYVKTNTLNVISTRVIHAAASTTTCGKFMCSKGP